MKWNRWIIKAAKIITRFTELGYWMTAALMLTAGIYSFADCTFLADALAGSIRTGRLELSVLGFEFSVPTANGIDMRAMLLYFAAAVVLPPPGDDLPQSLPYHQAVREQHGFSGG